MVTLLTLTANPWGLHPEDIVSGDVYGQSAFLGLPKLQIHVERQFDDDPRAPHDAWGMQVRHLLPTTAGVTPGDVLAYRQLWDPYVMGVVRAMGTCAEAWDAQSQQKPAAIAIDATLGDADTPAA